MEPKHYKEILNRRAAADIKAGTPMSWELIGEGDEDE